MKEEKLSFKLPPITLTEIRDKYYEVNQLFEEWLLTIRFPDVTRFSELPVFIQQAYLDKFFRDKHEIFIEVQKGTINNNSETLFVAQVSSPRNDLGLYMPKKKVSNNDIRDSYEQAMTESILEAFMTLNNFNHRIEWIKEQE